MAVALGPQPVMSDPGGGMHAIAERDASYELAKQDELAVLSRLYLENTAAHPGLALDPEGAPSREAAEEGGATVGDAFPVAHALVDSSGKLTDLRELVRRGPVIVTYFRGNWCTLCMLALRHLSQSAPLFKKGYGAGLVAISGQLPPHNRECEAINSLAYPVLCDKGLALAQDLGIVYKLTQQEARFYDHTCSGGFDAVYGPDHDFQLPLPAVFVLQRHTGAIGYAFVDSDLTKRSRLLRIEAALDSLSRGALPCNGTS